MKQDTFILSREVHEAILEKRPVVALESTIIAHGMPHPQNLETGLIVEQLIHENGAQPATIAVVDGVIKVGLSRKELEQIAGPKHPVVKLSTRDLPYAISQKLTGATTVAATMHCAAAAGIHVFATGGIGGVHRYAQETFDISADVTQLSRTNVAVVCAGAKAILDIPKTLEYLETYSVPVIGYGTSEFPAFYSRDSGEACPCSFASCGEVAEFLSIHWSMGMGTGAIVANPIPLENEIPKNDIEPLIEQTLDEARKSNITGKEVTPFLLRRIAEITEGKSLAANIALVKSNAVVGARLACELRSKCTSSKWIAVENVHAGGRSR